MGDRKDKEEDTKQQETKGEEDAKKQHHKPTPTDE